jgi:5-methylcytosine-specific restriction endonuclease McrA
MEIAPCPKCGQESPFKLRPDTQHHGEIRCPTHGHLWISKPTELKTPRRKINRELFELVPGDMQEFCWTCLRHRDLLKTIRPSVSLQAHHIFEAQHGGIDHRDNVQILCDECHAAVHRTRGQLHRYDSISNFQAFVRHERLTQ